ncbi:hypothetical protein MKZ38_005152 [Zalerion maritima]|uniref:Uncharacterized protein n=1 Tax=Zalerion maritima TaxID=339359 RepID=A0AAD5WR52_9PEZI|nr:hypothetical protein MKZ38_005152 [Zalerion maritima]
MTDDCRTGLHSSRNSGGISNMDPSFQNPVSSSPQPSGQRRRLPGEDEGDSEEEDSRRTKRPKPLPSDEKLNEKWFACPYHKGGVQSFSCRITLKRSDNRGWKTIPRLKWHLTRRHMRSHRCPRCWTAFETPFTPKKFPRHADCEIKVEPSVETFMSLDQEAKIREKLPSQTSYVDMWWQIYQCLIPAFEALSIDQLKLEHPDHPYYDLSDSPIHGNTAGEVHSQDQTFPVPPTQVDPGSVFWLMVPNGAEAGIPLHFDNFNSTYSSDPQLLTSNHLPLMQRTSAPNPPFGGSRENMSLFPSPEGQTTPPGSDQNCLFHPSSLLETEGHSAALWTPFEAPNLSSTINLQQNMSQPQNDQRGISGVGTDSTARAETTSHENGRTATRDRLSRAADEIRAIILSGELDREDYPTLVKMRNDLLEIRRKR